MPFVLSYNVSGDQQVLRRLERVEHRVSDMTPAFKKIHTSFVGFERKQFDTEGASGSRGWKPIKIATLRRKLRWQSQGKLVDGRPVVDERILHMTRRLRKSLINKSSPDHVVRISPQEAFYGSSVPYSGVHQNPKVTNKGAVRRRPIELTERQRRSWVKILQSFIMGADR